MRHYEVVFLVHPDQSEQVGAMVDKYQALIEGNGGHVHRCEDWGRRHLAYNVGKVHKAHYVLMNIECDQPTMDEITSMFKFSDAVLRNLVIRRDTAVTERSPLADHQADDDADSADSADSAGPVREESGDTETPMAGAETPDVKAESATEGEAPSGEVAESLPAADEAQETAEEKTT
ncbi:MAG TPA: 30S ribosomal protein S6 [Gammaproteobacteria bacterium]|jgi:small subunit ribosomal protein S6|nr:30S ribosomal protein S6 [Acidiferrobacteraceae bacterium]HCX87463.1 30S ribosomal protein S6 [Gammaproteobacteria bacterium]|tara:strand:+ start:115 stop:645 length:531 start_codon:yes stop_codon:yes gene_type:complete